MLKTKYKKCDSCGKYFRNVDSYTINKCQICRNGGNRFIYLSKRDKMLLKRLEKATNEV